MRSGASHDLRHAGLSRLHARGSIAVLLLVLFALSAPPVSAQSLARFSVDSAISVDQFAGQNTVDRPNIVVDVTGVMRLGRGWRVYLRPWFRQPRAPMWNKQLYQAALQYERGGPISTRVDLGYIVSPIGLGMMDARPDVNPTIGGHSSYFSPMPVFEPGAPRVQPIASTYPLGGQFTASTTKWDARAALITSPPNRTYVINASSPNPTARPIIVAGGGFTPKTGLRFGMGIATGEYAKGSELTPRSDKGRGFTLVSTEAEYAFGYTKLAGEVTHDVLETAIGSEAAYGWFLQGSQTLSPRWFVAARQEGTNTPPLRTRVSVGPRRSFHITEATVGFRLSTEITLRGSFVARKSYTRTAWDQQAGASLVWTRRWW